MLFFAESKVTKNNAIQKFLLSLQTKRNQMNIAVFCASSVPKNNDYIQASITLGKEIARQGHTLVYGGSNLGTMGHISGAALASGGEVIGVIPTFFSPEIIHSQPVTKLILVDTIAQRKEYIIHNCDAFIALPGGIGTLDEILEVMVAKQLNQTTNKPIVLYNPNGFFNHFIQQIDVMGDNGFFRSGRCPEILQSDDIVNILNLCISNNR